MVFAFDETRRARRDDQKSALVRVFFPGEEKLWRRIVIMRGRRRAPRRAKEMRRRINVKREMKRFMASETKRIVGKDDDDDEIVTTTKEKKKNTSTNNNKQQKQASHRLEV